jgi:hypothetical protein
MVRLLPPLTSASSKLIAYPLHRIAHNIPWLDLCRQHIR